MTSGTEDVASVVFIGNPGVGKSTIHNALGASFKSGFSPVRGMSVGEPQLVIRGSRNLLLVDVPGINDHATADSLASGETAIDYNLRILRNKLNQKGKSVVFFVIDPLPTGTIRGKDLALMKLILGSLDEGPKIGLIMTLIHKDCLETVMAPRFVATALEQIGADLGFFDIDNHLFLRKHTKTFSEDEVQAIESYILSFEPQQVSIRQKPHNDLLLSTRVERSLVLESIPIAESMSMSDEETPQRKVKNPQKSIIFIGSSEVGKTTLHNALGANFPRERGSSRFDLTVNAQQVKCNGRKLRLVDTPFYFSQSFYPVERYHLDNILSIDDVLNNGHDYMVFFVIAPRNGRIDPSDFDMVRTILREMNTSPIVGLVLTQVDVSDLEHMKETSYIDALMDILKQAGADVRIIEEKGALILQHHDDNFNPEEVNEIRDYVLSFQWPAAYAIKMRRLLRRLNPFK
ncbi:hypothetical protein EMPS_06795 [Entomortierella parvispora]|uniref:G domain-containing protein n=1 Tax=Entomortierella parvispora TaxID=205924 RepID=A0A9P3LXT5_9FUNG|nr:hypothetical protein EMPS_06795 [Entomortierella parvispora]